MKKVIKYIILVVLPIALLTSCTDKMEEMSVSDKQLQKELLLGDAAGVKAYIPTLAANVNEITTSWTYQVEQNLNADHFSGYMMAGTFGSDINNMHYVMNDGWNGFIYDVPAQTLTQMEAFKNDALPEFPDFYSYGLILKVLTVLPMVDAFGVFPYVDFGTGTDVKWDNLDAIYDKMISELDFAADTLTLYSKGEKANRISSDVSSYESDYIKLARLANSLKLRLALRMSDVAPDKAKNIAEKAVNHEYGVLQLGDGAFQIETAYNNPIWQIAAWGDIHIGADMESFLVGYDDPRTPKFMTEASPELQTDGPYKGIREGAKLDAGAYLGSSQPNFEPSSPMVLYTVAEAYFLRAEGALKGWDMAGDAEDLYEDGIRASFEQYGLKDVDDYLGSHAKPKAYVDPFSKWDYVATTEVTPNWDDASSNEEKLEKIITQKWIAIYPDGAEAWAEFRRTGYPKLKVIPSNTNPDIPNGEFIKRVPIPSNLTSVSPTRYKEAIDSYLGGQDNAGVRVWWDKE